MSNRSGFIAATAIYAIVILGAISVAVIFNATEETQITAASRLQQEAETFAEESALSALRAWPCESCDQMPTGYVFITEAQARPPLDGSIYFTRLDSALYLVTGEGRVKTPAGVLARRRVSVTVTARRDSLGVMRAKRTQGVYWAANYSM